MCASVEIRFLYVDLRLVCMSKYVVSFLLHVMQRFILRNSIILCRYITIVVLIRLEKWFTTIRLDGVPIIVRIYFHLKYFSVSLIYKYFEFYIIKFKKMKKLIQQFFF